MGGTIYLTPLGTFATIESAWLPFEEDLLLALTTLGKWKPIAYK